MTVTLFALFGCGYFLLIHVLLPRVLCRLGRVHFDDVLLGEAMGKEIECILGRLQKTFPVLGELRGTEDKYKETILFLPNESLEAASDTILNS